MYCKCSTVSCSALNSACYYCILPKICINIVRLIHKYSNVHVVSYLLWKYIHMHEQQWIFCGGTGCHTVLPLLLYLVMVQKNDLLSSLLVSTAYHNSLSFVVIIFSCWECTEIVFTNIIIQRKFSEQIFTMSTLHKII